MNGMRRSIPSVRTEAIGIVAGLALAVAGCGANHHLAEYDFRNRTLGVVTIAPPHPEVLSGASFRNVDPDDGWMSVLRAGAELVREVQAYEVRDKLDSAAARVDVADRIAARSLQNAARHLRARPVEDVAGVDYELEIRVRRYGIVAASWTAGAYFDMEGTVLLLDGETGRRIWGTDVRARDPVRASVIGVDDRSVTSVITAARLASMSTEEIQRALESLADFAADAVVARLADELDDVRN